MGLLDSLKEEEEFVELDVPAKQEMQRMVLQVESIENYADSDRIQKKIRDGRVLLVKVRNLRERDVGELRRAIDRIKRTCVAVDGDIAGIDEDWMVVCPKGSAIKRAGDEEKSK